VWDKDELEDRSELSEAQEAVGPSVLLLSFLCFRVFMFSCLGCRYVFCVVFFPLFGSVPWVVHFFHGIRLLFKVLSAV
jgi:hypothetical protein